MEFKRLRDSGTYEYLIPKEYIKHEYLGGKLNIYLGKDAWVPQRAITRILKDCCDMSLQEYYDLIVLGINNKEDRPKCLCCGSPLLFSGRLSHGYGHHPNSNQWELFCTKSCNTKYHHTHPEFNENWSKSAGFKNTVSETHRSQFLNKGNLNDICYFYIAKRDDGSLKYGITSDINSRIRRSKNTKIHTREIPYIKVIILLEGNRLAIANIEKSLKDYLGKSSEIIGSFSELLKVKTFIMSHLTSDLTLTSTTIS